MFQTVRSTGVRCPLQFCFTFDILKPVLNLDKIMVFDFMFSTKPFIYLLWVLMLLKYFLEMCILCTCAFTVSVKFIELFLL